MKGKCMNKDKAVTLTLKVNRSLLRQYIKSQRAKNARKRWPRAWHGIDSALAVALENGMEYSLRLRHTCDMHDLGFEGQEANVRCGFSAQCFRKPEQAQKNHTLAADTAATPNAEWRDCNVPY